MIEFSERLAEAFHRRFREGHDPDLVPAWDRATEKHKSAVRSGVRAVLAEINDVMQRGQT